MMELMMEDHISPRCQHGPVDVGHRLCAGLYVIIVVQDILLIIQELLVGSSVKARLILFTNINPLLLLPPGERRAFMCTDSRNMKHVYLKWLR